MVVIAGETGSGKTTQIPKMCMELGLAEHGLIGHTQPRRIAARSVAERLAEELGEPLGHTVGYQVRFTSEVGTDSKIKLMTDGILLAEIQHDPLLTKYSTIIVDEAHERSLNIDFLLGHLKSILPQRPGLKVIITSATIDPERFATHFHQPLPDTAPPNTTPEPAPIIEVSGRTYPVEIRYRPVVSDASSQETPQTSEDQRDTIDGVVGAVDELFREAPGDILVFFASEQEIREAHGALKAVISQRPQWEGTQVLPLFGRLSMAEQHKVFTVNSTAGRRRIVLATNVAETSVTVPGIRYVIDTGTARISRYSTRTKVQRLPIERISQASAQQRAGRCGRVADGICIRLYSEEDFASRPEFTQPEILRTNLASVILHMTASGVVRTPEDINTFPFVEPPETRAIKDGVALLRELGAISSARPQSRRSRSRNRPQRKASPLTAVGRALAALPVDPRLGRMIVEAQRRGCAREVMVLAAALSIQDPRERPADHRQAADEFHARFKDRTSDFLGYLLLWQYLQEQQQQLSRSAFRRLCAREYLNYARIREWQDLYTQLRDMGRGMGIRVGSSRAVDPAGLSEHIHKSLVSGLLSNIGAYQEKTRDYQGARGTRFAIFPGSDLFKKRPDFVVSAELVETTRLWARVNAAIDPSWVEEVAADLVKHTYAEPHWSRSRGAVMAKERATLYGVVLVTDRPVGYWRVDPVAAREMFIRHALVEGDWHSQHGFVARNRATVAQIEELENRLRRTDLRADDQVLFEFFDARIPAEVVSQRHFDSWWKKARHHNEHLLDFATDHLLDDDADDWDDAAFPRQWVQPTDGGELSLDLAYTFAASPAGGGQDHRGAAHHKGTTRHADGVTVRVPVLFLNQLSPEPFQWQIPGLRTELVTALIKSLPKAVRKHVVPAPDVARQAVEVLQQQADPARDALETALERALRQLRGVVIEPGSWDWSAVPEHLRMHFQVRDATNRVLAEGDDLPALQVQLRDDIRQALAQSLGTTADKLPGSPTQVVVAASRPSQETTAQHTVSPSSGLERDGLTDWPEQDLPRHVDTVVAGQKITGWPALESLALGDPQESGQQHTTSTVSIRVFSTAEEQHAAQRRGTIALLRNRLPSVHRYVSDHLGNREKMVFTQNPYGSVDALVTDCTTAAIDMLVPADPPWTRDDYDRVFHHVRAELIDTVLTVTALVAQVLTDVNVLNKTIKKPGSMAAVRAFSDLQEQLDRLVKPGFVAATGWEHLRHVPRYIKAMQVRVDKLVGTAAIQRDTAHMREIHALEDALDAAIAAIAPQHPVPHALTHIEWELQELRVSLFAQELGTAHKVSAKRIRTALRQAAG